MTMKNTAEVLAELRDVLDGIDLNRIESTAINSIARELKCEIAAAESGTSKSEYTRSPTHCQDGGDGGHSQTF